MRQRVEQIRQVGITYVTHRWAMLIALGVAAIMVPSLMLVMSGKSATDRAPAMLFLIGFPMLFGMMFLVMHVKTQFAHSRARLVPGFSWPHLIVLGGVLLGLTVFYPLLLASAGRFAPAGLLALSLAVAAPYAWGAHTNSVAWILVAVAVFFSLMAEWSVRWWIIDAPSHRPAHLLIIACGMALLTAWLRRLSRLREEMDDYQTTTSWRGSRKAGTEAPEQRRLAAAFVNRHPFFSWISDSRLARLGGYHDHRRMRFARLFRYGFGPVPTELSTLFILAIMMTPAILFTQLGYASRTPGIGALLLPVQFAIIMPGMAVAGDLARRRPRLAGELLFPLSRSEWVDGLLAASSWNALVSWLILNAGLVCVAWPILGNRVAPTLVVMFLLLSAAIALVLFGIALRTSFWDSMALRLGVLIVAFMVMMAPVSVWYGLHDRYGDRPFIVMALALAAVGAGFVASARRAWLRLQLG